VIRYVSATGDVEFERSVGVELLVETARLWISVGHFDLRGWFRIDGVTGPDEYSALADNNTYTNLMAQRNLRAAADVAVSHRAAARRLKVTAKEIRSWRHAADQMTVPFDEELLVHRQASDFTKYDRWDFSHTKPDQYPLFLHFPYFDLYRKQVVKQADLVLVMHLRGDAFTAEEKARNFAYYEAITVRDSSLSSSTQSVIAAEVGHLQLAHDYLAEAALMDLHDLAHNVRDGVHMGSLAGAWLAAVAGLGGMRHHGKSLEFAPHLPPAIKRLTFRMTFLGRLLQVAVTKSRVTYSLVEGRPLVFKHLGDDVRVSVARPVTRALRRIVSIKAPEQPAGRAPARRGRAKGPRELSAQPKSPTRGQDASRVGAGAGQPR
jgi:alpha,alpha-trehalose phosphorylase